MANDDISKRLQQLEERLKRIETRLGIPPPHTPPPAPPTKPNSKPIPPPVQPTTPRPAQPPITPPPIAPPVSHPTRPIQPVSSAQNEVPKKSLEMLIGGKWLGWIGAIVIVIGGGFIIKLGYDAGWWGRMTPALRCLLIAGFGVLLLIAGEVALRRVGHVASAGLFGAGLGMLYLDAYASFRYFELFSEIGAFALMGLVAFIGFAITFRTRFLTIGVISLIGGYLVPILLHGQTGRDIELLCYLTILFVIALGLSALRRKAFRPLRYVALGGQAILGFIWVVERGEDHWTMAIFFMSVWWVMVLTESIWAALRRQSAIGNVIMTLLATAGYVFCGCWVLGEVKPTAEFDWLGVFTVCVGVLSAVAALQFGSGIDVLRGPLRTAMDKLAMALWAQFGILLAVAIALQFEDVGQAIGWLVIALGSVEIGRRLPSRVIDVFGLVVWGVAAVHLFLLGFLIESGLMSSPLETVIWTIGTVDIDGFCILSIIAILTSLVMAFRLRLGDNWFWRGVPVFLTGVTVAGWLILCMLKTEDLVVTYSWLLCAGILLSLHRLGTRQHYWEIALVILVLTALRWIFLDTINHRNDSGWYAFAMVPVFNLQFGLAVLLAIGGWWWIKAERSHNAALPSNDNNAHSDDGVFQASSWAALIPAVAVSAAIIILYGLSFEIDRFIERLSPEYAETLRYPPLILRGLWWTALWAVGGMVIVLIGQWRKFMPYVMSGWFVVICAAMVWLVADTLLWRFRHEPIPVPIIFNLQFGVGILLIVLLTLIYRLSKHWRQRDWIAAEQLRQFCAVSFGLIALIGLWLGSLEIDRGFADDAMARQAGWSVYWSLYGMLLIVLGFILQSRFARYAGLSLLGITLLKVLLIDLSTVEQIWRVVSFIASGLLMVATSVLYAKFSPRLLETMHGTQDDHDSEVPPD